MQIDLHVSSFWRNGAEDKVTTSRTTNKGDKKSVRLKHSLKMDVSGDFLIAISEGKDGKMYKALIHKGVLAIVE